MNSTKSTPLKYIILCHNLENHRGSPVSVTGYFTNPSDYWTPNKEEAMRKMAQLTQAFPEYKYELYVTVALPQEDKEER